MRISDWSSDVCSSDLKPSPPPATVAHDHHESEDESWRRDRLLSSLNLLVAVALFFSIPFALKAGAAFFLPVTVAFTVAVTLVPPLEWLERHRVPSSLAALLCVTRSEEHTSELQSLMRISYAVFCLNKNKTTR